MVNNKEKELREDLKIAWMVETLSQLAGFTKTPLRVFVKEQKSLIDSLTKEEKVKLQRLMIERENN